MGACSQAPHAAPRQRQMGTFYVTQFSLGIIFTVYLLQMVTLMYGILVFFCKVHAKSCIGLGLRAALFTHIPFHASLHILTLHHADGGVGNSSPLSYAPSSAHVISFHSSKLIIHNHRFPHLQKVTCTKHLLCSSLLVTTFLIPFGLHMPLITIFSSLVMGLWGALEEEIY